LDARLTTLFCKKIIVVNFKEMKTDDLIPRNKEIWQHLLRKALAKKGLFCQYDYVSEYVNYQYACVMK
jgi:hypothetical protein